MRVSTEKIIARLLLDIGAIGFSPNAPITFKSGIQSPMYIDNRCLPFYPQQWRIVIEGFQTLISEKNLVFDIVAGIATAGIPHSAALSFAMGVPSIFIRKEAKEYGKQQRVEGGDVAGKSVVLIEDLVTTGGSSLSGVEALRNEGAVVTDLLAITSYGFAEASANFKSSNVTLHTLTNFAAVWEILVEEKRLASDELAIIKTWHSNPHEWMK